MCPGLRELQAKAMPAMPEPRILRCRGAILCTCTTLRSTKDDSYHVVALTSTTLGSLKLDHNNQNQRGDDSFKFAANGNQEDDGKSMGMYRNRKRTVKAGSPCE